MCYQRVTKAWGMGDIVNKPQLLQPSGCLWVSRVPHHKQLVITSSNGAEKLKKNCGFNRIVKLCLLLHLIHFIYFGFFQVFSDRSRKAPTRLEEL